MRAQKLVIRSVALTCHFFKKISFKMLKLTTCLNLTKLCKVLHTSDKNQNYINFKRNLI